MTEPLCRIDAERYTRRELGVRLPGVGLTVNETAPATCPQFARGMPTPPLNSGVPFGRPQPPVVKSGSESPQQLFQAWRENLLETDKLLNGPFSCDLKFVRG